MTSITAAASSPLLKPVLWPLAVLAATGLAYAPTVATLIKGPWQTEQEGHGPLIIAAALYLVWQSRHKLRVLNGTPAPVVGWACLLFGLVMMFISRTQDVLTFEAASILPVLTGEALILGGWALFRILLFPIVFLIFAVPAPDWAIDSLTVPLKVMISDAVTELLYRLEYPIAQNGVMIMVGTYKLMVKDACSGMNSIFALSAIGVFYVYAFRWQSKVRAILLLLAIIPITIIANFLRVLALVLMAYYNGAGSIEGFFHDATGIALFVVALLLVFIWDGLLGLAMGVARLTRRRLEPAPAV